MPKSALAALAALAMVPTVAAAGPTITMRGSVPFTQSELTQAVELRGQTTGDIRVTREGDYLLVEVDGTVHPVRIDQTDSHSAARLVAMIVVAIDDGAPGGDREQPGVVGVAAPPARTSPWWIRAAVGLSRDDGGTFATPLTAALSYEVNRTARLVLSASLSQATAPTRESVFIPLRAGIEGRAGAAGIELGGMAPLHHNCAGGLAVGMGGYAMARVYLPFAPAARFVLEAGGYYMLDQVYGCDEDIGIKGEAYGGHFGAGVEWRL